MTTNRVFVPPIKIRGIKTKLVPLIREIVRVDPSTIWVEPFMDSGVVGFNVAPKRAVFADTNPHVIAFYRAIQAGDITASRVRAFLEAEGGKLREKDDLHYYAVRERFNRHHDPLDFLFLNRLCFNGMIRFNRTGDYNVPYGHKPERFAKAYVTKIVNQVAHVEDLLRVNDWRFVEQSFEETLASAPENAFVYCDPPYIGRHVDHYDRLGRRERAEIARRADAVRREIHGLDLGPERLSRERVRRCALGRLLQNDEGALLPRRGAGAESRSRRRSVAHKLRPARLGKDTRRVIGGKGVPSGFRRCRSSVGGRSEMTSEAMVGMRSPGERTEERPDG